MYQYPVRLSIGVLYIGLPSFQNLSCLMIPFSKKISGYFCRRFKVSVDCSPLLTYYPCHDCGILNDLSFIQKCKQSPFQPEEWIPGSMPRRRRESGETDTCTPPKRFRYNLRWGLWYINRHQFTLAPFCTWMLFNILVITIAHLSYLEKGGEITNNCDMRKIISWS